MTYRTVKFVPGEIYHTFNRSVAKQPVFTSKFEYQRALDVMKFYIYQKPALSFSHYNRLQADDKKAFLQKLNQHGVKQVEILAFCLMPNHFHFLLKEMEPNGISKFLSNFQNSYAKFFNTKHLRSGSLFQEMFKAVRIEDDEQLIHTCRYIHLNLLTGYVLKTIQQLEKSTWCSYQQYLNHGDNFVNTEIVLSMFKNIQDFKSFTEDQISYQRELALIKHLTLE